jgi:hypothetical protein
VTYLPHLFAILLGATYVAAATVFGPPLGVVLIMRR